mmetsp:Transcript_11343/g.27332  ORF Transcript_11343/g.27332 Transcript_11343/m.27332 type:complete len:180 (+) Transcript_11343:1340-1879(+)
MRHSFFHSFTDFLFPFVQYAKMIRGDPAIEKIFYWESNQTTFNKPEPKLPGSGVHLVTGPINIEGGMPGDILQVDILELDPRPNADGKTFGTNSQKFAGYQYRLGKNRFGIQLVSFGFGWQLISNTTYSAYCPPQVKNVTVPPTLVLEEPKPLLFLSLLKTTTATCFTESPFTCTVSPT